MCWYCGKAVTAPEPIGRSALCEGCGKDLRVCRNCRFYLSGERGRCAETQAEPVLETERANFCDWFSLNKKPKGDGMKTNADDKAAKAKSTFDSLFS
jgi:hypothetical protein